MDNRIIEVQPLKKSVIKKLSLEWLTKGDNQEYLADDFVQVTQSEKDNLCAAAQTCYHQLVQAAKFVVEQNLWKEVGIPANAVTLVKYSFKNELDTHLISRFDFAGGVDGLQPKLIEINADTCSLLPETALIQQKHFEQEKSRLFEEPYNPVIDKLVERFTKILYSKRHFEPHLLISTLGFEEDWLNAEIVAKAAEKAGFKEVRFAPLQDVIFSQEDGIFLQEDAGYVRFDFWYKFIPWDFIIFEEPELMLDLQSIVLRNKAVILNPAYTFLLQSKALLKIAHQLFSHSPYLLKSSFSQADFLDSKYVAKPFFGRMGENIAFYDGSSRPVYETEGDYGSFSKLYQALAPFNIDEENHRYQPSIYFTDQPAGMCFRRQDDLIIDDDAEFVGHTIKG